MEKIKEQRIQRLDIREHTIEILNANNIILIGELCKKSKAYLKMINIVQSEIDKIEIELQLLGLNLKNSI